MTITERIDAITHLPRERMAVALEAPRSVKIELTARCNFACTFCARAEKLRDQRDMDRVVYTSLIWNLRDAGVEELGLFYLGESFLLPWLPEAIAEAKALGFPYVFLTTNGSLAKAKRTRACFEAGLDSLKFSFNYIDRQQFEAVARVNGRLWDAMRDNVLAARIERDHWEARSGHRCGLYASYIEYDAETTRYMEPLLEWLAATVDEVYALPLYNQAGLCAERIRAAGLGTPSAGNMGRAEALVPPLPCWAIFAEGHITYDGQLSACCFDHDNRFSMGQLDGTNFMELWNGPQFRALRTAHLARDVRGTVCEGCVAW